MPFLTSLLFLLFVLLSALRHRAECGGSGSSLPRTTSRTGVPRDHVTTVAWGQEADERRGGVSGPAFTSLYHSIRLNSRVTRPAALREAVTFSSSCDGESAELTSAPLLLLPLWSPPWPMSILPPPPPTAYGPQGGAPVPVQGAPGETLVHGQIFRPVPFQTPCGRESLPAAQSPRRLWSCQKKQAFVPPFTYADVFGVRGRGKACRK
ncbi:hypothetical protein AAFF_G00394640 [Aldrovandia affinis]|uniref:Secreted protein n=1 Tax=Aldrovandia affinis TaxID=143900 RepID=A0AAD7WL47_9TELE|nr:hypothetical protein AAFF_G00394640 [Aldrovandia affinis]